MRRQGQKNKTKLEKQRAEFKSSLAQTNERSNEYFYHKTQYYMEMIPLWCVSQRML